MCIPGFLSGECFASTARDGKCSSRPTRALRSSQPPSSVWPLSAVATPWTCRCSLTATASSALNCCHDSPHSARATAHRCCTRRVCCSRGLQICGHRRPKPRPSRARPSSCLRCHPRRRPRRAAQSWCRPGWCRSTGSISPTRRLRSACSSRASPARPTRRTSAARPWRSTRRVCASAASTREAAWSEVGIPPTARAPSRLRTAAL